MEAAGFIGVYENKYCFCVDAVGDEEFTVCPGTTTPSPSSPSPTTLVPTPVPTLSPYLSCADLDINTEVSSAEDLSVCLGKTSELQNQLQSRSLTDILLSLPPPSVSPLLLL